VLLPEMPSSGQLIAMTLPHHCCCINLAAPSSTAGVTPLFCHLLIQATPTSPRTNN